MPSRRVQGKFKFTFSVSVLSYYIRLSFKWPRFFWFTDQLLWLKQEIQKKFSGSDSGIDVVSGLLAYSVVATGTRTDVSAALCVSKISVPIY